MAFRVKLFWENIFMADRLWTGFGPLNPLLKQARMFGGECWSLSLGFKNGLSGRLVQGIMLDLDPFRLVEYLLSILYQLSFLISSTFMVCRVFDRLLFSLHKGFQREDGKPLMICSCGPVEEEWDNFIKYLTTSGLFLSERGDRLEWAWNSTRTITARSTYSAVSGPQTAFGGKIWADEAENIGIASGIGPDFPCPCKKWLEDMGIDSSGLLMCSSPTFRAWQIMEVDGRRTQVRRVYMGDDVWDMLRPPLCSLPMTYRKAKVYHVGVHPSGRDVGFIQELRNSGAEIVSIETYKHARDRVSRSELMALGSAANIFSANEKEAASLVGPGSPLDMIERIAELGAEVVTLRRGPSGSIVHRSDTRETWEIPAFHAICPLLNSPMQGETRVENVVDPTGCGNTFCGAFLIGWWKTRDLLVAGLRGSVAASFVAEYEGLPPPPLSHWREQAQVRLDILRPSAKKLNTPQ